MCIVHISIQRMFKALHMITNPVVGYNFETALTVHNFHSPGSIPCQAAYHSATGKYILRIVEWNLFYLATIKKASCL